MLEFCVILHTYIFVYSIVKYTYYSIMYSSVYVWHTYITVFAVLYTYIQYRRCTHITYTIPYKLYYTLTSLRCPGPLTA